jgi:hypothetical protein
LLSEKAKESNPVAILIKKLKQFENLKKVVKNFFFSYEPHVIKEIKIS